MIFKLLCSIAALCALASSACGNCGPDVTARGAASATWSITVADLPTTCAHVGATSVSLRLHPRASGEDATFSFACTATASTTPPVTAAAYDATLTLLTADGATVAAAPTQAGVTIGVGQLTALAPVAFAVSDRGKLALSFATLSTRTNCLSKDQGGAGITGDLITVERADGGCAPVTLVRSRKNTTVGSYTVNCSSPAIATLTAAAKAASGTVTLMCHTITIILRLVNQISNQIDKSIHGMPSDNRY